MKCGDFVMIRMLLLEIKLDQIRPSGEYRRPLGNHSGSFFISFGSELRFKVSVRLLLSPTGDLGIGLV